MFCGGQTCLPSSRPGSEGPRTRSCMRSGSRTAPKRCFRRTCARCLETRQREWSCRERWPGWPARRLSACGGSVRTFPARALCRQAVSETTPPRASRRSGAIWPCGYGESARALSDLEGSRERVVLAKGNRGTVNVRGQVDADATGRSSFRTNEGGGKQSVAMASDDASIGRDSSGRRVAEGERGRRSHPAGWPGRGVDRTD